MKKNTCSNTSALCVQKLSVSKANRAEQKGQRPAAVWLTGLSGSGKSTVANALDKLLYESGRHSFVLDGDGIRLGLNRDLQFSDSDRVENIRRVGEVAKLLVDAGIIVVVALISPFRSERLAARQLFDNGEFIEVFIDTPLVECERRDPKGLYARARAGMIRNFTGISSVYEVPDRPDLHLYTDSVEPEALAKQIAKYAGYISA